MMVQDQFLMSMNGPVALNQMAIHSAMELIGVDFPEDCFQKVVNLGRHFISKMREAQK